MDVGVRMGADRLRVLKREPGADRLDVSAPDGTWKRLRVRVTATHVQTVDIGRIDGQREIVRALTAALRRRKHVGRTGDDFPLPRRRIEAVDTVECAVAVPGDERIDDRAIAGLRPERDSTDIRCWKSRARGGPCLTVGRSNDPGAPFRCEELPRSARTRNHHAAVNARANARPFERRALGHTTIEPGARRTDDVLAVA